MNKIITLILSLNILFVFSQIGIVGEFTGWGSEPDIPMTHLGGGIWSASNVAVDIPGGIKFRINNDWATNWGWNGNGLGFPSGLAITGFSQSIPSEFGTYNVTFNVNTLEYSFIPVYTNQIGFHGGFNNFLNLVPMYSMDGINYCKKNFYLKNPNIKFRDLNNPFLELGGNSFPSGFASINTNAIPSLPGFYDISININTWEYSFIPIQIGLIGSSIPPYNWIDDAVMYSPDMGITNYVTNFTTINGFAKFRTLGSWSTNFGNGSDFPTGIATNGGQDIPVIAGNYDTISFNRETGQYCFGCLINSPLPQCNSVSTDTIIFIGSICDSFYVSNNNQYYSSSGIY